MVASVACITRNGSIQNLSSAPKLQICSSHRFRICKQGHFWNGSPGSLSSLPGVCIFIQAKKHMDTHHHQSSWPHSWQTHHASETDRAILAPASFMLTLSLTLAGGYAATPQLQDPYISIACVAVSMIATAMCSSQPAVVASRFLKVRLPFS